MNHIGMVDHYCQVGDSFCQHPPHKEWEKSTFLDPQLADFELQMKNSMMGRVMDDFEKAIIEQTKKVDEMCRASIDEDKRRTKERQAQHIPDVLKNEGVSMDELWQKVHDIIINSNCMVAYDESSRKASMKCLDPHTYQMILSHGISAWLSTLDGEHLDNLIKKMYMDASQWIYKIWRFRCTSTLFHSKQSDGILTVCKAALADRYPKYQTEGYNALYSRPPVFYFNSAVETNLLDYLRINIGLPSESIVLVPNNFELTGDEAMDPVSLEQLIQADLTAGKMPLLVFAYAGSPNIGSMDMLNDIHDICRNHKIWLHIEGLKLAQLALLQVPITINSISSKVKSMTLDISSWIGVPSVPYVTLVSTSLTDEYLNKLGFGVGPSISNNSLMDVFPIWFSLQLIGHDGIVNKINDCLNLNKQLFLKLKELPNIKVMFLRNRKRTKSKQETEQIKESGGIKNLIETVLTFLLEGFPTPAVIIFRYRPPNQRSLASEKNPNNKETVNASPNDLENSSSKIRKPNFINDETEDGRQYFHCLNQWLADNLFIEFPRFNVKAIFLPSEGLCLRICIQENIRSKDLRVEHIDNFVSALTNHINVMDATVRQRSEFQNLLKHQDKLIYIELPSWAGLGSIIYLPESCQKSIFDIFPDRCVKVSNNNFLTYLANSDNLNDINKINKALVHSLRNDDEAFSLGRYDFDVRVQLDDVFTEETLFLYCVRFGLITENTSINHLINLVMEKAMKIEESKKDLEKLSKIVRDGICKVTTELAKEQKEKLKIEGIWRQVPYIDSIMNWWSPVNKSGIIGRSLNLSSGEIKETEDTYKYKMQLQTNANSVFSIGIDNEQVT